MGNLRQLDAMSREIGDRGKKTLVTSDEGFSGAIRSIAAEESVDYVGDDWNDKISSVSVEPNCRLRVWEHAGQTGNSASGPFFK